MSLVLDSSAVLAWVHGDERTPEIEAVFDRVVEEGAIVPNLWHLEVANSLTVAVRRKRVAQAFRDDVLKDLGELNISVDGDTAANAWSASVRLADLYGLTVYDAAYLELAQRLRLPLATLDRIWRRLHVPPAWKCCRKCGPVPNSRQTGGSNSPADRLRT